MFIGGPANTLYFECCYMYDHSADTVRISLFKHVMFPMVIVGKTLNNYVIPGLLVIILLTVQF